MEREIKFRGIYPHSGTWFYGCFVNVFPDTPRIVSEGFSTPIKIETLGQFTGLKDKNGVDIYEGDILNIGTVVFERGTFGVYPEYTGDFVPIAEWSIASREIIGNIHQIKHQTDPSPSN